MNQRSVMVIVVALLGAVHSSVSFAQESAITSSGQDLVTPSDPKAVEIAAIRAESQAFVTAFNKGDAKAIAALWTEDGEYVEENGHRFVGRAAIEQGYSALFADHAGAQIHILIDSLRLVSDNVAIEEGRAVIDPQPIDVSGYSKYTATHVKVAGRWQMASVRDTWVDTPPAPRSLADLGWLIGTWVAEEHGLKNVSVVSWVANDRFIERKYTTTLVDGSTTSGVQLIGWNPAAGYMQSWTFSPDGGHAIGVWRPQRDGWSAEMHGVAGDGTRTTSVNLLSRLDDTALLWQSVRRTADGIALPDTQEVVAKRQPAVVLTPE